MQFDATFREYLNDHQIVLSLVKASSTNEEAPNSALFSNAEISIFSELYKQHEQRPSFLCQRESGKYLFLQFVHQR